MNPVYSGTDWPPTKNAHREKTSEYLTSYKLLVHETWMAILVKTSRGFGIVET